MRAVILIMLLAGLNTSAVAEWYKIYDSEESSYYVDLDKLIRAGDIVSMWSMFDLKKADLGLGSDRPILSMRLQYEYDCRKKTIRAIGAFAHAGHMGSGDIVKERPGKTPWQAVPKGLVELDWKAACGKG